MIRINLLPEEFRKREKASIKTFLATALGALVVSGILGYLSYIYFGKYSEIERKRKTFEEDCSALLPRAAYDDQLKAEKKDFANRERTIKKIRQSRVLWTRKLDQFIDIINNNGDDQRHLAWFKKMDIKPGKLGKRSGITVSLNGYCAGNDVGKVANLFDDIMNSEFFTDFVSINEPSGKLEKAQENLDPKECVSFPLKMFLVPGISKKPGAGKKGGR